MRIELGAPVQTRDGQDAGTVDRLVVDPERGEVKAAVIRKGIFLPRDVEAPLAALTVDERGAVRLTYTRDQLDELPDFIESNYTTTPPPGFAAPAAYSFGDFYWPVPYGLGYGTAVPPLVGVGPAAGVGLDPAARAEVNEAWRRQDLENAVIGEGSLIKSRDGQTIGELDRLVFDAETGEVTGFVARRGVIFSSTVQLPASLIDSADDGVLYLNANAESLPT